MSFQKIVVPVDFSSDSERALTRGGELASAFGAELHVVHIVESLMYRGVPYVEPLGADARAREREAAQKSLDDAVAAAGPGAAGAKKEIVEGEPRASVAEFAQRIGADLIVIGATGHGRVHRALLGSVSRHVANAAHCSVLLVRN